MWILQETFDSNLTNSLYGNSISNDCLEIWVIIYKCNEILFLTFIINVVYNVNLFLITYFSLFTEYGHGQQDLKKCGPDFSSPFLVWTLGSYLTKITTLMGQHGLYLHLAFGIGVSRLSFLDSNDWQIMAEVWTWHCTRHRIHCL